MSNKAALIILDLETFVEEFIYRFQKKQIKNPKNKPKSLADIANGDIFAVITKFYSPNKLGLTMEGGLLKSTRGYTSTSKPAKSEITKITSHLNRRLATQVVEELCGPGEASVWFVDGHKYVVMRGRTYFSGGIQRIFKTAKLPKLRGTRIISQPHKNRYDRLNIERLNQRDPEESFLDRNRGGIEWGVKTITGVGISGVKQVQDIVTENARQNMENFIKSLPDHQSRINARLGFVKHLVNLKRSSKFMSRANFVLTIGSTTIEVIDDFKNGKNEMAVFHGALGVGAILAGIVLIPASAGFLTGVTIGLVISGCISIIDHYGERYIEG